jgi:hypothetical protein
LTDAKNKRIAELEAEKERLRTELAIAQGANKALEEWVHGYRIRGRPKAK